MSVMDVFKAIGVAIGLLAFNMLIVIVAVVAYAQFIEPGHPDAFYNEAALRIAPWCTRSVGLVAFFLAGYFLTNRRTDRPGLRFALLFSSLYALLDAAIAGFEPILEIEFLLAMLANCVASLVGAKLAMRTNTRVPVDSES